MSELCSAAPDLSCEDAIRLMVTVDHGYGRMSPTMALLVDLGYLWGPAGDTGLLYPSVKGVETALRVAEWHLGREMATGDAWTVAEAFNRAGRLRQQHGINQALTRVQERLDAGAC